MAFNPLDEKGMTLEKQLRNWSELNVDPYDKHDVDPYTRTRVITLNGIETEAVMFSHQMARHTADPDLRRALAFTRRIEQQQQKAINWLIPGDESTLEVTIGYEQVAVDLTAYLARTEPDPYVRQVLEFGLLEDFDHLYRYANLMDLLEGKKAEKVVGYLTEIMPGRPTVEEHRHPHDDIRLSLDTRTANPLSLLHSLTIVAAEQQTMNFYMTIGNRPMEPIARGLYLEIGQIEEQHVTQYESLLDPSNSWLEQLVLHEYNECYLYYSFMVQEADPRIRKILECHLDMELAHLGRATDLMRTYERRDPVEFLPREIPEPIRFEENKAFVRQVLAAQCDLTARNSGFVPISSLPRDDRYFDYQSKLNQGWVPSEEVIDIHERQMGTDYRLETEGPNPVPRLERETLEMGEKYQEMHRHGIAGAGGELELDDEGPDGRRHDTVQGYQKQA